MTDAEQRAAAKKFAEEWKGRGYEKGESQPFWLSLLRNVLGVTEPEKFIVFEDQVHLDHTSFIDGSIPSTHVLIEQKSLAKDLRAKIKQSDGTFLTPFQQAKRYSTELPYSNRPRYIVTCNFSTFLIYNMENPSGEPEEIQLASLAKEYYRLNFLTDSGNAHLKREMQLSIQAGEIVGLLYDEIFRHYKDPTAGHTLKSLNMLCVRLVFCLYAEDAGIFSSRNQFHDYLAQFEVRHLRQGLLDLFKVLNTKPEDRDPYLNEDLAAFAYVNGGLFAEEDIEIPQLDDKVKEILLAKASGDFDWSDISPTIFGAVFESTLNPETRRSGGMHYTSIENIHKVIDPLFLNALKAELAEIKALKVTGTRNKRLVAFQNKLAGLTFLDPACGSGNFLTETYLSLRRMENEILETINAGQAVLDLGDVIKVSIGQFYGIEINDFAVTVAKTALWIAESQMMKATEDIVHLELDFLPLKSYPNIVEGNALRIDWNSVVTKEKLNYIMGNPPFVGAQYMTKEQKQDVESIFHNCPNWGVLDFVTAWFKKSADFILGSKSRVAFVATNSICQGEQVAALWKQLWDMGIRIDFAYRTFRWDSEASLKAHVHCVIVGFSNSDIATKLLFNEEGRSTPARNISPYLLDAPSVFVKNRKKPICEVPQMTKGCQPTDGGHLIVEAEDLASLLQKEPEAKKFIRNFMGAVEFINAKKRYCLWLPDANPLELKKMPAILERIQKCREMRLKSSDAGTRKLANTPTVFRETYNPERFIIIPSVSSERRKYVPMGFMDSETIASNLVLIIPDATLYHFGVLTSTVHMAWMRAVCGRLKSDYRYSKDIVYNNFPWPDCTLHGPDSSDRVKISSTARTILDARAKYPDASFADLYGENMYLFADLLQAHQANDLAVLKAYGFAQSMTEPEIVAELLKRYQTLLPAKDS